MDYILDTFDRLKQEVKINQLPRQAKNYNEIKKQLESIKIWLIKDNEGKDIPIIKKIDESLQGFKEVTGTIDFRIVK